MGRLLIVMALVGLPLLTVMADLNHRRLARTAAMADAALRRAKRDP
jgi:hypothetical protein